MDYLTNKQKKASASQVYAIPLINALFSEVNPIPIKYAVSKIGFDCGKPRLPLVELSDAGKEKIDLLMKNWM